MSETAAILAIAACIGVSIAFFFIGASASPDRARAMLGKRASKYESVDEETLRRAVRATYWGLPGIAFMLLIGALYGGLFLAGPMLRGKVWLGFALAAVIGIGIARMQLVLLRSGIERYLERRLTP